MKALIEKMVGDLDDKRRWREYRARVKALPASYRAAHDALTRYLTHFGVVTKGEVPMGMLTDLVDLFERAAARGTPVRAVVGEDPVGFAETFFRRYSDGRWTDRKHDPSVSAMEREFHREIGRGIDKERERLVSAIARTGTEDGGARS